MNVNPLVASNETHSSTISSLEIGNLYRQKLVLFLHISKCGGSTINYLLQKHMKGFESHDKKYSNVNGLPLDPPDCKIWTKRGQDRRIRFAVFDEARFDAFMDLCHSLQTQYVCTEFEHIVDFTRLQKFNAIICLRNPLKRYISQMHFYEGEKWQVGEPNMMVRTLCNKYLTGDVLSTEEEDRMLNHTIQLLSMVDIIILEQPQTFRVLEKFGIDVSKIERCNVTTTKSEYGLETEKALDVEQFKKDNRLDYALYDHACKLAEQRDHESKN